MSSLTLPIVPANLRTARPGIKLVESDMFDICERLYELDRNLYVYELDPPVPLGSKLYRYAICEMCADRVERLVMRVEALDARVITELERMLRVPFEHRFAEAERQEAADECARKESELNELADKIGLPMLPDLERTGFIQRSVSYPKRGVKSL